MKKTISMMISVVLCASLLAACAGTEKSKESQSGLADPGRKAEGEIIVYAAASLAESLEKIIAEFEKENPGVEVTANFGSSGDMEKAIAEDAECDLFIPAAKKQMDQLDETAGSEVNTEGLDYVVQGTRIDLLENKCVLAVPDGNPADISSFNDLKAAFETDGFIFAMGGGSVPVGAYTQKIFEALGLDEQALASAGKITYGEDVKGVTSAVKEAVALAGIIYASDAYSAQLEAVDTATEEMTGGKVIYPAALIKTGKNAEAAKAFLEFLQTDTARKAFEGVGFTALK